MVPNSNPPPKVAIFYDWLTQWGGAERLLLDLLAIYPNADLFTSCYRPSFVNWLPKSVKVSTTALSSLPAFFLNSPLIYPLIPPLIEAFDFANYQIIISLTSQNGHCLITPPQSLFLCYCLTPNRYLYQPKPNFFLKKYQTLDLLFSRRPDHFLTTSLEVQKRITRLYKLPSTVIRPGVDLDFFTLPRHPRSRSAFLIVSRLVKHKNIDLAIRAAIMANVKLTIIGTGRHLPYLKKISAHHPNIQLIGSVTESRLRFHYQNSLALICPQVEDFGLTPLESLACGTPVIALNAGGIPENLTPKTGILYNQSQPSILASLLSQFKPSDFSPQACRHQALNFSRTNFMINFQSLVSKLSLNHKTINDN